MPRPNVRSRRLLDAALALSLSAGAVLTGSVVMGQGGSQSPATKVDPAINSQFVTPNLKGLVEKLETEDREVFARREAIVNALDLKPGMAVADVGAGTGLFTRMLAERVGSGGTVYAVDISRPLLKHIGEESKARGQIQVKTVLATQDSSSLAADSIDLAFVCDAYHHLEKPKAALASVRRALRPNGLLVVIDLDRSKAKAGSFVKTHVRAEPSVFAAEIRAAGFEPVPVPDPPALKENVFLKFRKAAQPEKSSSGPSGD